ncbi:tRNA (N6-threonylcarbamoyladenosine(37)-N6)-methyltransferase TrmO [Prevotella sp.]|uniref:tRNA (N6-threonylcarbamoyladenosine(37)-N6)-methyltransferase TrmO n=1 Tax=Prevotella sp. TaxID=59823 RepID=UPI002F928CE4
MNIEPIAYFQSPFKSKFGVPKQSGLVEDLEGKIVFEPAYRNADALRGIEDFDYLWLIWAFSANKHKANSPVVRPPLLGGNEKMGVFATRSPFRPNGIGLSCVKLDRVDWDSPKGPVVVVKGADLMDGTPIFDIKPYVVYADCKPGARSGFVDSTAIKRLRVDIPAEFRRQLGEKQCEILVKILELDPRPHYQNDPQKVYGMPFEGMDVKFCVDEGVLTVTGLERL